MQNDTGQCAVTYTNSGTTQPIGSLTQVTLGSADKDTFSYDRNTGRLTQYKFIIGATPQTVQGDLTWNVNGTLAKLVIADPFNSANAQTCTFGYDDLARVKSANCGAAWSQTFSLDPFGNASKSGNVTFQPGFDQTKNWFLPVTGFDNNGNLLSDVAHTYTWDAENKLTAVDTVSLTFDALGRMVEQARASSYTQILYSPGGGKLALMNGQTLQKAFCPLPGGATAVYNSSGVIAYYRHSDWLGSSRFASTPSRTKYFDVAYAPYGEDYADSGTTDLNFTGQNQDTVSGLYDFLYREYHPNSGRWIQPDPAGLRAVSMANPQTLNRYAYVGNMPLNAVDPLGLSAGMGNDVFGHHPWGGLDEFDLAEKGILPIGGVAGFCPAQFTGCIQTNGGTLGQRFDGTVSQFSFGDIISENGDAEVSGLIVMAANGLKDKFLDFLATHADYLPGVCTAGVFGYATVGPGNASGGIEYGRLVDKHIGSPTTVERLGEASLGPVGVGMTPSEMLVFVQPAPKVPVGFVFAASPQNGFINNSGISIGFFAGKPSHGKLGPIPAAGAAGGGAYLTFSSAANCLQKH